VADREGFEKNLPRFFFGGWGATPVYALLNAVHTTLNSSFVGLIFQKRSGNTTPRSQ